MQRLGIASQPRRCSSTHCTPLALTYIPTAAACRLFRGFSGWLLISTSTAASVRTLHLPQLPGVYEWGASPPQGGPVTAFYVGKAGQCMQPGWSGCWPACMCHAGCCMVPLQWSS